MTCGACKHQPAGEACPIMAPACTPEQPPEQPPAPVPGHGQALLTDEELKPTDLKGTTMWTVLWAASDRYKAAFPGDWNPELTCLTGRPVAAAIDRAYEGISAQLAVRAAQSIKRDGQKSDCIFVNRNSTDLFEQYRLFEYGRGCEATGPTKEFAVWRYGVPALPAPVVGSCPSPQPPKLTTWGLKPHVPKDYWDISPLTWGCDYKGPGTNFCEEIGLGWMGPSAGEKRCTCPARPDGHPDRVACEAFMIKGEGTPLVRCEVGMPDLKTPYLAACPSGGLWIEVCGRFPGAPCRRCNLNHPAPFLATRDCSNTVAP
jgi:hypothetical protein